SGPGRVAVEPASTPADSGAGTVPAVAAGAWALPEASAAGAAPAARAAAVALISSRRVRLIAVGVFQIRCRTGLRAPGWPAHESGSAARTAHAHGLARVLHRRVGCRLQGPGVGTRPVDPAHPDLPLRLHSRPAALALADQQLAARFAPRQRNAAVLATLIAVVAAVVFVQGEAAVGAGVDLDGQRCIRLLVHVLLHHRARDDRAGAHVQRAALQRRGGGDFLPAGVALAGVEVDPAGAGRQVHLALARLVFGDRGDQERRAEQVLVGDVAHLRIAREIHRQRAQDGAVLVPGIAGQGVDVGQQGVPQLQVVHEAVVVRRAFRRDLPDFAVRELPVQAEDRHEGAVLEPAQVLLAPLVQVRRVLLLVAPLRREAADVEADVGRAGHRRIDQAGDLLAQVIPARHDVAAPECRRRTLLAGEIRAREDEHALVRVDLARAAVYAFGVWQRIGVEVLHRRAQGIGHGARLALAHVDIAVQVRLGRIQPPGIEALAVELGVELAPEDVLGLARERIVEGIQVSRADPVKLAHLDVALVHEPGRVQLLVVLGGRIELRPHRDH